MMVSEAYPWNLHLLASLLLGTRMKSSDPLSEPYAAAGGPGFLLVQDNARPLVARVCRQFLDDKGIDAIDWPSRSPDLNPIKKLLGQLCIGASAAK